LYDARSLANNSDKPPNGPQAKARRCALLFAQNTLNCGGVPFAQHGTRDLLTARVPFDSVKEWPTRLLEWSFSRLVVGRVPIPRQNTFAKGGISGG